MAAPFDPIYAANKHAVVGLVRSIGAAYAAEGINVHALCPSFTSTNIIKGSEQMLLDLGFPILEVATSWLRFNAFSSPRPPASAGT